MDLHKYRERIQVMNEDIQSFMFDNEGECNEEDNNGNATTSNHVHNLELQPTNY